MKPKEPSEFSWTGLFLVTAFCFLAFSGLIKLLHGSATHSSLFFKIGLVTLVLYVFSLIGSIAEKKNDSLSNSPTEQDY